MGRERFLDNVKRREEERWRLLSCGREGERERRERREEREKGERERNGQCK